MTFQELFVSSAKNLIEYLCVYFEFGLCDSREEASIRRINEVLKDISKGKIKCVCTYFCFTTNAAMREYLSIADMLYWDYAVYATKFSYHFKSYMPYEEPLPKFERELQNGVMINDWNEMGSCFWALKTAIAITAMEIYELNGRQSQ
jgi:hypothetical protein